jgi:tRNA (guanine-N7-)-methyltransferase
MSGAQAERKRGMLYGRRKGPALSAHQQHLFDCLLPRFALDPIFDADPRNYFSEPVENVWLEVGFGGGEHLIWQAQHHSNVGLIGAEPYVNGVVKLLSHMDSLSPLGGEAEEDSAEGDDADPPFPRRGKGSLGWNIRLYPGDARDILEALPDQSLGRAFILFPDPWPKTRHHKRRFIQMNTLNELARVMKPRAELRFASDDSDYVEWTLERLMEHPGFQWTATRATNWRTRPRDWPPTRYEGKQLHGKPVFLEFLRT